MRKPIAFLSLCALCLPTAGLAQGAQAISATLAADAAAATTAQHQAAALSPLDFGGACDAVVQYNTLVGPEMSDGSRGNPGGNNTVTSATLKSGTDNTAAWNATIAALSAATTNRIQASIETNPQSGLANTIRLPNNCQFHLTTDAAKVPDGVTLDGNNATVVCTEGAAGVQAAPTSCIRFVNSNANNNSGASKATVRNLDLIWAGTPWTPTSSQIVAGLYLDAYNQPTVENVDAYFFPIGIALGAVEYAHLTNVNTSHNRVGRWEGVGDTGQTYPGRNGGVSIDNTCIDCHDRGNALNVWRQGSAGSREVGGSASYATTIPFLFGDPLPHFIGGVTVGAPANGQAIACAARSNLPLLVTDAGGGSGADIAYGTNASGSGGLIQYAYPGKGYTASTTITTVPPVSFTGTTRSGSAVISAPSMNTANGIYLNEGITGAGIPAGAVIKAIGPGSLTLSAAATASASGVSLTSLDCSNPPTFTATIGSMDNWGFFAGASGRGTGQILIMGKDVESLPSFQLGATASGLIASGDATTSQISFIGNAFLASPNVNFAGTGVYYPRIARFDGTNNTFRDNWGMIFQANPYDGTTCPLLSDVAGAFTIVSPDGNTPQGFACDMTLPRLYGAKQLVGVSDVGSVSRGSLGAYTQMAVPVQSSLPGTANVSFTMGLYAGENGVNPQVNFAGQPSGNGLPGGASCSGAWRWSGYTSDGQPATALNRLYFATATCIVDYTGRTNVYASSAASLFGSESWGLAPLGANDLYLGNQKATSGMRYACIDTSGHVIASATACSGS